jgi:AGZA family xanthine/uracil permease-like MFS transporter
VPGALGVGILNVILVFFLVELFDATGTLMGVASRAGLLVEGKMERLNKALLADSAPSSPAAVLGTSSTTAYIESAAGVQAGGRTGLTALTVAVLFLACLFIAPLAGVVPAYATAPALLFVACLMLRDLGDIEWGDTTEAMPAAITALVIPFTYSIAEGIAFGFITYAALKLTTGRAREVKPVVWVIACGIHAIQNSQKAAKIGFLNLHHLLSRYFSTLIPHQIEYPGIFIFYRIDFTWKSTNWTAASCANCAPTAA